MRMRILNPRSRAPTTVLIGENVRDNAALDAQFIASVSEDAVLQLIMAVRTDAGIEVRDGPRRTPAARQSKTTDHPAVHRRHADLRRQDRDCRTHRTPDRHQRPAQRTHRCPTAAGIPSRISVAQTRAWFVFGGVARTPRRRAPEMPVS